MMVGQTTATPARCWRHSVSVLSANEHPSVPFSSNTNSNLFIFIIYPDLSGQQCFRCQRFGHNAVNCRAAPRCVVCSGAHNSRDCPSQSTRSCCNCSGNHTANYGGCPKIRQAREVEKIRQIQKLSYRDAARQVLHAGGTSLVQPDSDQTLNISMVTQTGGKPKKGPRPASRAPSVEQSLPFSLPSLAKKAHAVKAVFLSTSVENSARHKIGKTNYYKRKCQCESMNATSYPSHRARTCLAQDTQASLMCRYEQLPSTSPPPSLLSKPLHLSTPQHLTLQSLPPPPLHLSLQSIYPNPPLKDILSLLSRSIPLSSFLPLTLHI
ncbi:hypothetical protein FHG87_021836 [Trinorchestia longiramus]|nr:hypothetical protein FHG87_021836 [Trinorchestia longiramus]